MHKTRRQLYTLLAELYPDQASAVRIAQSAGIGIESVPLTNQALNNWHAILQEAEKQNRLVQLLAVVEEEYGENRRWQALKLQLDGWPVSVKEFTVAGPRRGVWMRWRNGLLIGLLLLIGVGIGLNTPQAQILFSWFTTTPTPADFTYNVTVRDGETNRAIADAQVQIAVEGKAPLTEYADSNGFARIFVPATLAGRPGLLTVEADGYAIVVHNIDLWLNQLPTEVRLARE